MAFLDENGVAQLWAAVKDRLAGAFDSVEFDIAEQAANLVSGDSIATAFGKLAKNYSSLLTSISDLNTTLGNRISEVNTNLTNQINTKLNKSDVLANYTTTATGKALDASLGPAIKTKMDLADELSTRVGKIEGFARGTLAKAGQAAMTYHEYSNLVSITLPANSGSWLILGNVAGVGGSVYPTDSIILADLLFDDATDTVRTAARTTSYYGGGCMAFALARNSVNDRTVTLRSYGYFNVAHDEYGVLIAINYGF